MPIVVLDLGNKTNANLQAGGQLMMEILPVQLLFLSCSVSEGALAENQREDASM